MKEESELDFWIQFSFIIMMFISLTFLKLFMILLSGLGYGVYLYVKRFGFKLPSFEDDGGVVVEEEKREFKGVMSMEDNDALLRELINDFEEG